MTLGQRVYYLTAIDAPEGGDTILSFPFDSDDTGNSSTSGSFGIFVFPRHDSNRGKPRALSFPAIRGFGDAAIEITMTLKTDYEVGGNSNRLICVNEPNFPFLEKVSFNARKLPSNVKLRGSASSLDKFNLWALVPADRDWLESLWREHQFYFLGYGNSD